MPSMACYAQYRTYPNGGRSAPFIVPMSRSDVVRFSRRILENQWPEWKGCLLPNGRVDGGKLAAKLALDDFPSGSARLDGAHDGRYWGTMVIWARVCRTVLMRPPPGALSDAHMAVLIHCGVESGTDHLHQAGIHDVAGAVARTMLALSECITEWEMA